MLQHVLNPEQWIDDYSDQLLGYAVARVRDRDIAKDLVQETFFVALRSQDKFRGEVSEKNWLYLILRSRILDHYKKKKEVPESQIVSNDDGGDSGYFMETGHWNAEMSPREWSTDRMLETKEFLQVLDKCRGGLSELQNAVFTLKYLDGEASEDICKELDITSSNYWVLVHRAKLQLRKCLEKNWMT